ncbi:protease complex subunit PrcB family protein [bacterium]|nr:protease complex subunit PrcB family protein [bacterium]
MKNLCIKNDNKTRNKTKRRLCLLVVLLFIFTVGWRTAARAETFMQIKNEWEGWSNSEAFPTKDWSVIKTEAKWEEVWNKLYSHLLHPLSTTSPPPVPDIDFNTDMIIAVFNGAMPNGGCDVEIIQVVKQEEKILVKIKETRPSGGYAVVSYPYHIVQVERSDLPVEFLITETVGDSPSQYPVTYPGYNYPTPPYFPGLSPSINPYFPSYGPSYLYPSQYSPVRPDYFYPQYPPLNQSPYNPIGSFNFQNTMPFWPSNGFIGTGASAFFPNLGQSLTGGYLPYSPSASSWPGINSFLNYPWGSSQGTGWTNYPVLGLGYGFPYTGLAGW